MPKDFLSSPHDLTHWSVSIQFLILSASISDVRQVYSSSPLLLTCFSSTQRLPVDDTAKAQRLAEKLWQLRILDDEKSASDVGAPILVVSQFTLYANTAKGRRPTWNAAAPGAVAEPLVTVFADALRGLGAQVETGVFGADMQVALVNDGPVTVLLEL